MKDTDLMGKNGDWNKAGCPSYAIEIFGDAYQSIMNAVELAESVSKCF